VNDREETDPEDWEGVTFHTHEDGTRHVTVNIEMGTHRRPWWRSQRTWRIFRWEVVLIAVYTIWTAIGIVLWGWNIPTLLTSFAMLILLTSIIIRSINSYRMGFAMGLAAVPLAMAQPSPRRAAELIDRSSELWDPSPTAVAHTMAIERLERDVNRGK
jgi:hypothetical protein